MFIRLLHRGILDTKARWANSVQSLQIDKAGEATIEWALVLAAIALPMYFVFRICLDLLVAHYQMVSFIETLPFP